MKRLLKRLQKGQRGFTLLEVLITLAILAIIAGIAVPVTLSLQNRAKTNAAVAELASVQGAVGYMMLDEGLSELPDFVTVATSNMAQFPDWKSTQAGGYVLIPTDAGNHKNAVTTTTDWLSSATTTGTYTCTINGTVTQVTTGY